MFEFDPEYVTEMSEFDFDPHLSLAVVAGKITEDEYKFYKWYKHKGSL